MNTEPRTDIASRERLIHHDRQFVLVCCLLLTVAACALIAALYWHENHLLSRGVTLAGVAAAVLYLIFRCRLAGFLTAAVVLLGIVFGAIHFMSLTSAPRDIGVYWYYATILGSFFFLGSLGGLVYTSLCIIGLVAVRLLAPGYEADLGQLSLIASSLLLTALIALFYETAVFRRTHELTGALTQVRQLATVDYLTGANNRRNFMALGETLFEQPGPLTVIVMDIDNFKACNDTYGHAAGDEVLRTLVNTIRTHLREDDIIGRLGGEEFAVLLPVDIELGWQRGETLRRAVAELDCQFDGTRVPVTVSIGIARQSDQTPSLEALLTQADSALYQAKRAGKNRVVTAQAATA